MALTITQRDLLVIHLLRDEETLQTALETLDEALWNPHTEILEMLSWTAARALYRRDRQMPLRPFVEAEVRRRLQEDYAVYGVPEARIAEFFNTIYGYAAEHLRPRAVLPWLDEFLVGRTAQPDINQLLASRDNPRDIIDRLYRRATQVTAVAAKPDDLTRRGIDVFHKMDRRITGCGAIDELMGGIRFDECLGLLGPMKGGKTSLCQTLACEWIAQDPANHRVTYMTYEESVDAQWPKMLICCMNQHHRREVEGRRFADMSLEVQQDLERAWKQLKKGLRILDMSLAVTGQGGGGPAEMASYLMAAHRRGELGQLVIVDHARPLVLRHLSNRGLDVSKNLRHEIANLCNTFKSVTERLHVAGILVHQMSAEGNRNCLRIPSHMDSSECKMFPEMLNHVVCLGVKDERTQVAYLNLSASRSLENRHIRVKIAGWKCRVEPANNYIADEDGGGFRSPREQVGGRRLPEEMPDSIAAGGALPNFFTEG